MRREFHRNYVLATGAALVLYLADAAAERGPYQLLALGVAVAAAALFARWRDRRVERDSDE